MIDRDLSGSVDGTYVAPGMDTILDAHRGCAQLFVIDIFISSLFLFVFLFYHVWAVSLKYDFLFAWYYSEGPKAVTSQEASVMDTACKC